MTVSEGDVRNAKHPGQENVTLSMGVKDIHFCRLFSLQCLSNNMLFGLPLWFSLEIWTPHNVADVASGVFFLSC